MSTLLSHCAYVLAGGPGSGRHPGFAHDLPKPLSPIMLKLFPKHHTWKEHNNWHQQAYGAVMVRPDGKFLLREPSKHFDGYAWTFAKGKADFKGEHPTAVAHREVAQETGHTGDIIGRLPGNYSTPNSNSNFYMMTPRSFDESRMDQETQGLRWVGYHEAKELIGQSKNPNGRARDLAILDSAQKYIDKYKVR